MNGPSHHNAMWLATVGFVVQLEKSNRAQLEDAIVGAKQGMNDYSLSAIKRQYFKTVLTILRKQLKEFAPKKNPVKKKRAATRSKKKVTRKRNPRFTEKQLSQMRANFAKIDRIDPSLPTYGEVTKYLDGLSQTLIKQIAGARIKFLSKLASNRIKGKA